METNKPANDTTQPSADSNQSTEHVVSLGDILGTGSTYPMSPTPIPPATSKDGEGTTPPVIPVAPVTQPGTPSTPPVSGEGEGEPTYLEIVKDFANPQASDDIKGLYQEVLTTFKGKSVDAQGNVLDANNKIIMTADKVEDFLLNDNLPLNEEGALVDVEGNVLKTADEILAESSTILSVKAALESNLAITFPDTVAFPDTIEGIVELVSTGLKQQEKKIVTSFLEANPEVKQFTNHLALGGTPDTYKASNIDYKAIDIKVLDNQTKLNLLNQSFKEQGNTNPGYLIDLIAKAGDEAINKATYDALKFLDEKQTQTNAQRDAEVAQAQAKQIKEVETYWNNVEQTINSGKLNNLNIPVKERQAFFEFMSKPVDEDFNSAESLKAQKESLEFQLLVSYLRFKDGDLSQLATNIAKDTQVKSLTERMNKNRRIDRNGVPRTISSTGKGDGGIPSLNDILGNS